MTRRSKDLILLVLAVAVLALALYTFRGKPASAPGQPAGTASAESSQAGGPEGAEKAGGEGTEAVAEGTGEGGTTRSPFAAPEGSVATAALPPDTPSAEQAAEGPEQTAGAEQPTPEGAETAGPGLTLTGIVAERPTVAVIREDGQRHFVKVGDQIGDRYRVQAIRHQQVVLASKDGQLILKMGGRQ